MQATPEYVTDLLSKMRRVFNPGTEEWLVNEEWISDSRAPDPLGPNETEDAEMEAWAIAGSIERLWLARQAGQPVYLELRCEAEDLMQRIARVALPYGVHVYSGSGADGLKPKKEAASGLPGGPCRPSSDTSRTMTATAATSPTHLPKTLSHFAIGIMSTSATTAPTRAVQKYVAQSWRVLSGNSALGGRSTSIRREQDGRGRTDVTIWKTKL